MSTLTARPRIAGKLFGSTRVRRDMPGARTVDELIGAYQADGGPAGELRYLVGKLVGTAHCELCDISHGLRVSARPAWKAFVLGCSVPFRTVHMNERSPELARATDGRTPCVVARVEGWLVLVLGPEALARCRGDVDAFREELTRGLARAGLQLPP